MWVFGYGSLMWDNWERDFGCSRKCSALLKGYRRTFNKASTHNRGTRRAPCPTLNLEKEAAGTCKGMAFAFPDERRRDVLAYLGKREGPDFHLELLSVRLDDDTEVQAHVPVYCGKNLISSASLKEKAAMVRDARGTESSCEDYVKEIAELLAKLKIDDPAVTEFWQEVQFQKLDNK
jgi:glutathione-specific gamma-glutamylcyclotransferase